MENKTNTAVTGCFVDVQGERYYKISHVDQMAPFFISVVSSSDHWLFISSTGCLSAGRIRPENALFPYRSVDQIHENADNTGPKTIVRISSENDVAQWEPFNPHHDDRYQLERNLYKNTVGDKILFEEINHSLALSFTYSWQTSEQHGFVRHANLANLGQESRDIRMIDGLLNILPSGAPLTALQTRGALVDAYKWNEQSKTQGLALFSLYARLSDRAEPAEALRATAVYHLGADEGELLLSSNQLKAFRQGKAVDDEPLTRGVRGAYLLHRSFTLDGQQEKSWSIVADIDQTHSDIVALEQHLIDQSTQAKQVDRGLQETHEELIRLMSGADAWQCTEHEAAGVHHYANVLFNNMRGGIFEHHYQLITADVLETFRNTNRSVYERHRTNLKLLPERINYHRLLDAVKATGDEQLIRICLEYLPLTFGRRHGDPSRPWNHYEIKLKDDQGKRLLSYQGNWRDIFQNWEAIALSYPGYILSFLTKFVNASTMDGYNPYRITKQGIDWEFLEPEDPWSNIGYWGDHQIIYLLKFLEQADRYNQSELLTLLDSDVFCYANVPYRLCDMERLFKNPKDTVTFDDALQAKIDQRVAQLGSDGRLVFDHTETEVYHVNLTEKIIVPLLAKLSNLVIDGGIWLNTQRPEWNDANNAIVGNGLSMVTLYYMRRYIRFLQGLMTQSSPTVTLSVEVVDWLRHTASILSKALECIESERMTPRQRMKVLQQLQQAAETYRTLVYHQNGFNGKTTLNKAEIMRLLDTALPVIDATITNNLRQDGLYNAYNILGYDNESLSVDELYPMLEGQVAILSAGILSPKQAVCLLDKLFSSEMYRADQHSFMLYPDRALERFMDKNVIDPELLRQSTVLTQMLEQHDYRLVSKDLQGKTHFHPSFENVGFLKAAIYELRLNYPHVSAEDLQQVIDIYESTFQHKAFTGRSGTMFGYEGLGCIYWHMVSKLLLAVQENYQLARQLDPDSAETQALADYYYLVREGIGFNKSPENYGAFPTDPYSHTPKHAGAQQPGMTGQVKEEVITRFGELGVEVVHGEIHLKPTLLIRDEFLKQSTMFTYYPVDGERSQLALSAGQLAFTLCQVPFIYQNNESSIASTKVYYCDGQQLTLDGLMLPGEISEAIFSRNGKVEKVIVTLPATMLRD